jgi:hypothetical protein
LSENSLYTVDAWQAFLNHLDPERPAVCVTLVLCAGADGDPPARGAQVQSLRDRGVSDPAPHLRCEGRILRSSTSQPSS